MRLINIIPCFTIFVLSGCLLDGSPEEASHQNQTINGSKNSACIKAQGICAPYGPVSEGLGCPAGSVGSELSCSSNGSVGAEEVVCCLPATQPPPPITECAKAKGTCAPYGPVSEGFGCPQGSIGSSLSCQTQGGPVSEEVCCMTAPGDCRTSGCGSGTYCASCAAPGTNVWSCIPDGASC